MRAERPLSSRASARVLASCAGVVLCVASPSFAAPLSYAAPGGAQAPRVDLQQRLSKLPIADGHDGLVVTVDTPSGPRDLSAEEYVAAIRAAQIEQQEHGWLYVLFNITSPIGLLWVTVGFLGQALFTFRMVLQWLASEKHKRSVVPVAFWWGSLIGGLMLLTYFIWRKDIVGIVGQSTGAFVYARNLVLIYRHEPAHVAASADPRPNA